ncbi:hypothetical protein RCL1_007944 [Eukaryota sp. TZLM3-RCL]
MSQDPKPLLTSLEHPGLVESDQYSSYKQQTYECFSTLDFSKQECDSHDLWLIRNQILKTMQFLASNGLYHKGLTVSNIIVCSLRPIKVKLSRFSNSGPLIGVVDTLVPIQDFWKQKCDQQEAICFCDLIRSIVMAIFPYSIKQRRIVFCNPKTLEREDLESIRALICSIEYDSLFKCGSSIQRHFCVNLEFSFLFSSLGRKTRDYCIHLPSTLLYHVFIQALTSFKKPLLQFNSTNDRVKAFSGDFSTFATTICNVSLYYRHAFFQSFDSFCSLGDHHFIDSLDHEASATLVSFVENPGFLLTPSSVLANWFNRFPPSIISLRNYGFDFGAINGSNVSKLDLRNYHGEYLYVDIFPNIVEFSLDKSVIFADLKVLSSFNHLLSVSISYCYPLDIKPLSLLTQLTRLSLIGNNLTEIRPLSTLENMKSLSLDTNKISDISPLSSLFQLTELSLNGNSIDDLSPLSSLFQLTSLYLCDTMIFDLWPLKDLHKLSTLDVRRTLLSKPHRKLLTSSKEVRTLVASFEKCIELDLSTTSDYSFVYIRSYCNNPRIKALYLQNNRVTDISLISTLVNIETLDLSGIDDSSSSDYSFLSACTELRSLTLDYSDIDNLSSLSLLHKLVLLSLKATRVTNLTPLSMLHELQVLLLDGTSVSDLFPLSSIHSLERLSLYNTGVYDLWPLKNLNHLSFLDVRETLLSEKLRKMVSHHAEVRDLVNNFEHGIDLEFRGKNYQTPLNLAHYSNFGRIRSLNLSECRLDNVNCLSRFVNLETMKISKIKVGYMLDFLSDFSFLSSCTELRSLSLDFTEISDLSPLIPLQKLTFLSLNNTRVGDMLGLSHLNNLTSLSLTSTNVSDVLPICSLQHLSKLVLRNTKVVDLSPLKGLQKLSFLDVRETLLPIQNRKLLISRKKVVSFLSCFV